jgi:hypothetical protein
VVLYGGMVYVGGVEGLCHGMSRDWFLMGEI